MKRYVDLIASRYEWTCPSCEILNHVTAIPKKSHPCLDAIVVCRKCKRTFLVDQTRVEHARD